MEYSYKPTTHGRSVLAAYMALGTKPFNITRVAFGSGKVSEDVNLADVHELLEYVTDGSVAERAHKDERLFLTIQYANSEHKDVPTFLLSEFIVYVEDPVTGKETDLLYGTLGDYRQPVPAYNPAYPPSVFNFPLELILSDELQVNSSAAPGLVSWEDLRRHNEDREAHPGLLARVHAAEVVLNGSETITKKEDPTTETDGVLGQHYINLDTGTEFVCTAVTEDGCTWEPASDRKPVHEILAETAAAVEQAKEEACSVAEAVKDLQGQVGGGVVTADGLDIVIPASGWEADEETGGAYPLRIDIQNAAISESHIPVLTILPGSLEAAGACGLCPTAQTLNGILRLRAKRAPDTPLNAGLALLGGSESVVTADDLVDEEEVHNDVVNALNS